MCYGYIRYMYIQHLVHIFLRTAAFFASNSSCVSTPPVNTSSTHPYSLIHTSPTPA